MPSPPHHLCSHTCCTSPIAHEYPGHSCKATHVRYSAPKLLFDTDAEDDHLPPAHGTEGTPVRSVLLVRYPSVGFASSVPSALLMAHGSRVLVRGTLGYPGTTPRCLSLPVATPSTAQNIPQYPSRNPVHTGILTAHAQLGYPLSSAPLLSWVTQHGPLMNPP